MKHTASLPPHSVGYRANQPRFKGAVAGSHCRRPGGMGAVVATISEKYSQPQMTRTWQSPLRIPALVLWKESVKKGTEVPGESTLGKFLSSINKLTP